MYQKKKRYRKKTHCHTMAKCCVSALKKPLSLTSFYRNFAVGRDTWYWLDTPIRLALGTLHVGILNFHVSLIWVFACFTSIGFFYSKTELKIIKWKIAFLYSLFFWWREKKGRHKKINGQIFCVRLKEVIFWTK